MGVGLRWPESSTAAAAILHFKFPSLHLKQSCPVQLYRSYSISKSKLVSVPVSSPELASNADYVTINWLLKDGSELAAPARVGSNLMRAAQAEGIELEGACEGVCACSTCHIILTMDKYEQLPEPSEEEEDMLDLAFGLTATSRLGCQVVVTPEHDGMVVQLPKATRNFYVVGVL